MITALYGALLVPLFIYLSFRVIALRRKHLVAIGDKGHQDLQRAMRVHGNFAEYVPFALLLIYLLEVSGAASGIINGLGIALLLGRLLHAFGVSQVKENLKYRQFGMILTFSTLLVAAAGILAIRLL